MGNRIAAGPKRPVQMARVRKDGWTVARRQQFLDTLAATCNVRMAIAATGLNVTSAYALRRRDPVFAELWREALTVGYEQLEAALLAHALQGVNALAVRADDCVLPERKHGKTGFQPGSGAQAGSTGKAPDVELALLLLNRHRASVEGNGTPAGTRRRASSEETDAALRKKLDAMARRLRAQE